MSKLQKLLDVTKPMQGNHGRVVLIGKLQNGSFVFQTQGNTSNSHFVRDAFGNGIADDYPIVNVPEKLVVYVHTFENQNPCVLSYEKRDWYTSKLVAIKRVEIEDGEGM